MAENEWTVLVINEDGRVSADTLPPENEQVELVIGVNGRAVNVTGKHLYGGVFDTTLGTAMPADVIRWRLNGRKGIERWQKTVALNGQSKQLRSCVKTRPAAYAR